MPKFIAAGSPTESLSISALANRVEVLAVVLARHSITLLRMSLGVVFIWFGALKFSASTPVADLVASTVPFVPAGLLLPALGGFEVVLGIGLLIGRRLGLIVLLMVGHLAGTFLVLVTQPAVAFQDSNPLYPTMTGEFVIKNLVLISAGLVLVSLSRPKVEEPAPDTTPVVD